MMVMVLPPIFWGVFWAPPHSWLTMDNPNGTLGWMIGGWPLVFRKAPYLCRCEMLRIVPVEKIWEAERERRRARSKLYREVGRVGILCCAMLPMPSNRFFGQAACTIQRYVEAKNYAAGEGHDRPTGGPQMAWSCYFTSAITWGTK